MPVVVETGRLRPFNAIEIAAMEIQTTDVRAQTHPTETREIAQSTMRRAFFCKWEERYNFVAHVCGDEKVYGAFDNALSRMLPDPLVGRHPDFPQIVATKIEAMRGHGRCSGEDAFGMPVYPKARVEVMYSHVPYELEPDEFNDTVELGRYTWMDSSEVGGDSITGTGGMMKFRRDPITGAAAPDNVPVPYSYNVIRPTEEFSIHWTRLPYGVFKPDSKLDIRVSSYLGTINQFPFFGRDAGTLLFLGASKRLERAHTGVGMRWSVEYKFLFAPDGHTKLRYFDTAGAGAASGWYFVGAGPHRTPDTLQDYESLVKGSRPYDFLFDLA